MRITFLAGCLEPGKDGVGDYTRILAEECTRLGAACQTIALADRHAPGMTTSQASGVETLRLPGRLPWPSRVEAARRATGRFAPDWASVQFVPYSFHRLGIATRLVRALPRLVGPARLHVMFHEIWIGPDGSWRRRLVSGAQRRCVLRLCRYPETLMHTSNSAYEEILKAHGVAARPLPLFGNIPVATTDGWNWLAPQLAAVGCDAAVRRGGWWLFVLFGALHPCWPPEPLFERLQDAAAEAGRRMALISVGRLAGGDELWRTIEARYAAHFPILRLGEQPDGRVSEVLKAADFGVATSPYWLLDKSGTAIAMLEHGLPVIVNREDGPTPPSDDDAWPEAGRVIRLDSDFARRLREARRIDPQPRRALVAARFLADLKAFAPGETAGVPVVA
jgi:glycosyltransferase involved in cell wall biosynthesis